VKQFIVVTAAGTPVASSSDPHEALHVAKSIGATQWLAPSSLDEPDRRDNPAGPENALRKSGVRPVSREEVEPFLTSEGLKKAHATLLPIFEQASRATKRVASKARGKTIDEVGGVGMKLDSWLSPGSGFLSANAKLMKRDDRPDMEGVAVGLNLVPEYTVSRLRSSAGVPLPYVTRPGVSGTNEINFCTGSSQECRTSCLAGTGQNASDIRNTYTKFAKAKALIEHPAEFMAILYAATRKYADADGAVFPRKATKFLRLNVLSDLPWELIAPWYLDEMMAAGVRPYDYSKVVNRSYPGYDLTFSYSGANMRDVIREHARGNKIAIVFLAPEYIKGQVAARVAKAMAPSAIRGAIESAEKLASAEATMKQAKVGLAAWRAMNPLPTHFDFGNGTIAPVVDGDYTDFRPWDPRSVDGSAPVVGLRWKTPRIATKKGGRREVSLEETPKTFVVMGEVRETPNGLVYALPHTPNNDENSQDAGRAAAASIDLASTRQPTLVAARRHPARSATRPVQ
jgi:hypothetical protein